MPSNAMKISQFVQQLQALQAAHGDLDVVLALSRDTALVSVDGRNVNVAVNVPWQRLPQPAVVIGLWSDQFGVMQPSPGQAYQVTADASDWDHDRDAAPSDKTELVVWKRYLGQDRGYRDGDKWYVYEGGERPVEIIPAGILGWRLP